MPYVYPPSPAAQTAAAGGTADAILTADGQTVQQKLDKIEGEIDLLEKEKLILEFID